MNAPSYARDNPIGGEEPEANSTPVAGDVRNHAPMSTFVPESPGGNIEV
jgi:hypothetical protein